MKLSDTDYAVLALALSCFALGANIAALICRWRH